jgi:GNAT superfamily N-acetyltransferase
MRSSVVVEQLSGADIAQNVALSNSVAWPDTEGEWRVLHEAALVLGVRGDGALVGQGALGLCEGAGSVAQMIVADRARRQGIGAAILDELLAHAARRALSVVGLVATPLGRPLYETRGFAPVGEVVILVGTPLAGGAWQATNPVVDAAQIVAIELRFMATSRAAMLRGRLRESCASALAAGGFALATAHQSAARIGPIIADDEATARSLASALFHAVAGPVRLDVPADQGSFRAWLMSQGLVEKGVRVEMARGGALPWQVPERFGLATLAWG